jgi:hypothetical protein
MSGKEGKERGDFALTSLCSLGRRTRRPLATSISSSFDMVYRVRWGREKRGELRVRGKGEGIRGEDERRSSYERIACILTYKSI